MNQSTNGFAAYGMSLLALALVIVVALANPFPEMESSIQLPIAWPPAELSDAQLAAAQACDAETLAEQRYGDNVTAEQLADTYTPGTACDWAVLAAAYFMRAEDPTLVLEDVLEAYLHAYSGNPALAFQPILFYGYYASSDLVAPPPQSKLAVTTIDMQYSWIGLGSPVGYTLHIANANTEPIVTGEVTTTAADGQTPVTQLVSSALDVSLAQAFSASMDNLLPVDRPITLLPCTDNAPDWLITLEFEDGSQLEWFTYGSNFLQMGGPWQTVIDGQSYIQYSFGVAKAVYDIATALQLPWGEPEGMSCQAVPLFDEAFPGR